MSIIYKASRIGRNGKLFTIYKLKTLKDEPGPQSTAYDDPRITEIGRWLRKTRLDELPQIYNVIKRDMNLIGWRPEDPKYFNTIPHEVLATRPGILGWATLHDLNEGSILKGSQDPDKDYEDKILPKKREKELWYVRNRSRKGDLKIIFLTLWRIIKR